MKSSGDKMKKPFKIITSVLLALLFALSPAILLTGSNAGDDQEITFSLRAEEVPEEGGDFDVYVSVSSNSGFYSEVLYIVYPDFLSVKSAEAVCDKNDPFSDAFALYTEKDVTMIATSLASVNDRMREAALSSGFNDRVGNIDDMIPATHRAANITIICSQSTGADGNTQNYRNLKPVSSDLAHYVFTYDPSKNPEEKTEFSIYLLCSASNAIRILSGSEGSRESFTPNAVSAVATGHDYEIISSVKPTCTENGLSQNRCRRCGNEKTVEIPMIGHDFVLTSLVKPQIGITGKKIYTCTLCSSEHEELIPAYVYLRGDANGDREINLLDIKEFSKFLIGDTTAYIIFENCDVDGNGQLNGLDLKAAKQIILFGE